MVSNYSVNEKGSPAAFAAGLPFEREKLYERKNFFLPIFLSLTKKSKDGRRGGNEKEKRLIIRFPFSSWLWADCPNLPGGEKFCGFSLYR